MAKNSRKHPDLVLLCENRQNNEKWGIIFWGKVQNGIRSTPLYRCFQRANFDTPHGHHEFCMQFWPAETDSHAVSHFMELCPEISVLPVALVLVRATSSSSTPSPAPTSAPGIRSTPSPSRPASTSSTSTPALFPQSLLPSLPSPPTRSGFASLPLCQGPIHLNTSGGVHL